MTCAAEPLYALPELHAGASAVLVADGYSPAWVSADACTPGRLATVPLRKLYAVTVTTMRDRGTPAEGIRCELVRRANAFRVVYHHGVPTQGPDVLVQEFTTDESGTAVLERLLWDVEYSVRVVAAGNREAEAAQPVAIAGPGNYEVRLERGGVIQGKVGGEEDGIVVAHSAAGVARAAVVSAEGTFTISGLPWGDYRCEPGCRSIEWSNRIVIMPAAAASLTRERYETMLARYPVHVAAGATTEVTLDGVPGIACQVSVRVRVPERTGSDPPALRVELRPGGGGPFVVLHPGEQGLYTAESVPFGEYMLVVAAVGSGAPLFEERVLVGRGSSADLAVELGQPGTLVLKRDDAAFALGVRVQHEESGYSWLVNLPRGRLVRECTVCPGSYRMDAMSAHLREWLPVAGAVVSSGTTEAVHIPTEAE